MLRDFKEWLKTSEAWCCPICYNSALPFADCSSLSSCSSSTGESVLEFTGEAGFTVCESSSDTFCPVNTGLSILHTNCRSLLLKIDYLRASATTRKPDIIALTETWLDNSIYPSEFCIDNYLLTRRDRNRGISLYVSQSIVVSVCVSHESVEFMSAVFNTSTVRALL